MKLKKQAGQFNTYSAELTYGEILVLRNGLQKSPGMGPEADEMLEGFNWYLEKMPEPGEEGDKKEGTSDNPNMAKDKADDALSPMLLEPAPGQEEEEMVAGEEGNVAKDEETLADRLGVNAEEEELPEPPTR
tara:strand:+ start:618 stop:1013 length:396 start_codon:yes stop_codon:yes gene_type:complete